MISDFIKTVKKYNMLTYGDSVAVGVSGGADSVLLLHLLNEIKDEYNLALKVAHIEHGIRGEESKSDALFVKELCEKLGVNFFLLEINAPEEAKRAGMSVEAYSRKKRYDFFESLGCDKIATAHNKSDNAETLIFRLARGTGLNGACCIAPVRDNIIRPLIEISSDEIRAYCDKSGIAYRVDSTNSENIYSRNLIRNVILKELEKVNSAYEDNLNSFIESAREDNEYLSSVSEDAYSECLSENSLVVRLLKQYPDAICKRIILEYFSDNGIKLDRIHLDEIFSKLDGGKVQISAESYAVISGGVLRYARLDGKKTVYNYEKEILNKFEFSSKDVDFYCDCDRINGSVIIRERQEGDSIRPCGRGCTKSLKKLFNEYSVPIEKRSANIVIADSCGIIGIVGLCCDERVKVTEDTRRVFTLKTIMEDSK